MRNHVRQAGAKNRKFTLVELLVVIAIIGILASLLVPSLVSASIAAKSSSCSNNQRQIFVTLMLYTQENSSRLPPTKYLSLFTAGISPYADIRGDAYFNYYTSVRNVPLFKKPIGLVFCPGAPKAAQESPCWTLGPTTASYYLSNYVPTLGSTSAGCKGAWCLSSGAGVLDDTRKIETIKSGSVLLSEQNYSSVGTYAPYTYYTTANWLMSDFTSQCPPSAGGANAPAWSHHAWGANMLRTDGSVRRVVYTGLKIADAHWMLVKP